MSGKDNVFFDSNVLIYHLGGIEEAKKLIRYVEDNKIRGFINPIVASETFFFYIKANTKMKSWEIKRKPHVLSKIDLEPVFELLSLFSILDLNAEIVDLSKSVIERYHLLPNDALIAATCEFYVIEKIATFDDDFKRVAGLQILRK